MRRRIDAPLTREWKEAVKLHLSKLISELKAGRASPYDQERAAKLLDLLTSRARGRPSRRLSSSENVGIAWAIDYARSQYADQGHEDPLRAAYRDFKEANSSLSDATIRDYHRKGIAEMRPRNVRFAIQIDAAAEILAQEGHLDPLREALAEAARRDGQPEAMSRLNYQRGKRRPVTK